MTNGPELIFVTHADDPPGARLSKIVRQVLEANRSTGLVVDRVDIATSDATRARELGVIEYPALIVRCDGVERDRLVGARSHRSVLHMLLPHIHDDPDQALAALRSQLDSPGEQFPRGSLKRHERLGKSARANMLSNVPLFSTMTKKQLAHIGGAADEVVIDAGTTLMSEGDPGTACFIVAAGTLEVHQNGGRVATLGPGDFVGEMSLIDGQPRTGSVRATDRSVLLALDRQTFMAMLHGSPSIGVEMLTVLCGRLRTATGHLSD